MNRLAPLANSPSTRVSVRLLAATDADEFVAAVQASRKLHHPWVSPPAAHEAFDAYLSRMVAPQSFAFGVFRMDTGALAGVVNLTNVIYGAFRSGYLGYYAFAPHQGQGLMTQGLRQVVRHAFGALKLHRLEANIQPDNLASLALARSCGFVKEGYSPKYLKINGRWRDHERWAVVAD